MARSARARPPSKPCGKANRIWSIVDLALGDEDGLDLVKEIKTRYPKVPSLVLSMHDEAVYAERALSAGALGYVTKHAARRDACSAPSAARSPARPT